MFMAAAGSVAPKTRKGRTATVRPSTNFINSNSQANTIDAMRKQRLRVMGIYDYRSDLIASLAWGDAA
jgi:hypothetical protein